MSRHVQFIKALLEKSGVAIIRPQTLRGLSLDRRELHRAMYFLEFLKQLQPAAIFEAIDLFPKSRGENFQDVFVMLMLGADRPGFFVEFGATDGISGSNSFMMEKTFGWKGILAEPALKWRDQLQQNRNVAITHKCVWSVSGMKMQFRESADAGFSTLDKYWSLDRHADRRRSGQVYEVETISLDDLLDRNNAPKAIDYISIDTEGSEYDILSNFTFDERRFAVVTVEHNFRPDRELVLAHMTKHNYVRAPISLSKYDDWYVSQELAFRLGQVFLDAET